MAGTVATTTEDGQTTTDLSEPAPTTDGGGGDGDGDGGDRQDPRVGRDCPHRCQGTLTMAEGTVLCQSCRCSPDGTYHPPASRTGGRASAGCPQASFFDPTGSLLSRRYPRGSTGHDGTVVHYHHSENVRLAGGFERVYDEDDDHRPDGVPAEYTFDLSTL